MGTQFSKITLDVINIVDDAASYISVASIHKMLPYIPKKRISATISKSYARGELKRNGNSGNFKYALTAKGHCITNNGNPLCEGLNTNETIRLFYLVTTPRCGEIYC